MNKIVKLLFIVLIFFGIIFLYITFRKTAIDRNYTVINEAELEVVTE